VPVRSTCLFFLSCPVLLSYSVCPVFPLRFCLPCSPCPVLEYIYIYNARAVQETGSAKYRESESVKNEEWGSTKARN
jgi:hypothetical protein